MFDALVDDLSQRYGLGDRGRDLFALLVAYIHNDRRGGFAGFMEGFREQGHGELAASWLGNPEAGGLNASDVGMVFGQGLLNDWGTRLGASRATVAAAIAGVLPRLVAELTPGGRVPGGWAPPGSRPGEAERPAVPAGPREPLAVERPSSRSDRPPPAGGAAPSAAHEPSSPAPFGTPGPVRAPQPSEPAGAFRTEPVFDEPARPAPGGSLRREPTLAAAPRAPVEARPALDPGEQRAAEMAALFDRPARGERAAPGTLADVRPDNWRSAMQPPRRKRGPGGLFWFVVLLALLAGAAWFAWSQGLLAPYIEQLQLPIQPSPSTV